MAKIDKINYQKIKDIIEKCDIVKIISNFVKLAKKGNNYVGICPFHPDTNPSLVVSPQKKIFKCFVCGTKGNVISFVEKIKNCNFIDAIAFVAKTINYDINELNIDKNNPVFNNKIKRIIDANMQANIFYKGFLYNKENANALAYLHNRGLSDQTIKKFEFGYATNDRKIMYKILTNYDNMFGNDYSKEQIFNEQELCDAGLIVSSKDDFLDFFVNRITIPIYDHNNYLVGFSGRTLVKGVEPKYLNTQTTKIFSKSDILFNFNRILCDNCEQLIICEGFMDVIALNDVGITNCIATMGVALTDSHISSLKTINNLKSIILAFDNDNAGINATIANGLKLCENCFNVYVIGTYDKKFKDVDELLHNSSKKEVVEAVENANDFFSWYIKQTFSNIKKNHDLQFLVNDVVKKLIDYGDQIFKTKHLNLISELTNLDKNDLLVKYEHLFKKNIIYNNIQNKSRNDISERNIATYSNNDLLHEIKTQLDKIIIYCFLINHKYIEKVKEKIPFDNNKYFDLSTQFSILKALHILNIDQEEVNVDNLSKLLKNKDSHNYLLKLIDSYDNTLHYHIDVEKCIDNFIKKKKLFIINFKKNELEEIQNDKNLSENEKKVLTTKKLNEIIDIRKIKL